MVSSNGHSTSVSYTAEGIMFSCIIHMLLVKQDEFAAHATFPETISSPVLKACDIRCPIDYDQCAPALLNSLYRLNCTE